MQGRYMDVRSRLIANPYYVSLDEGRFDLIKGMGAEELQEEIDKVPDGADAGNKRSFLEAALILKKMEGYGIAGRQESTRRKASAAYRKDWVKVDVKGESNIGYASANGQIGAGMVRYVDGTGKEREGFGVNAGLTAKAAVFEGSVGGGITIFGVRFGGRIMGNAMSVGFSTKVRANTKGVAFGISLALGLGTGFEISIDWSGLKGKLTGWRKRKKQRAQFRELREREKAHKHSETGFKKEMNL